MKLTIAKKVISSVTVILMIGILAMVLTYRSLKLVENEVHKLAQVNEPLILAAYEMEINMNGIGLEVLKYLSTRNPRYRELVSKDVADFAEFHETWQKLIATAEERMLDRQLIALYGEFKTIGVTLMARADNQERLFGKVTASIEEIDDLIHNEVQLGIDSARELTRSTLNKAIASANLESELAELGFWTSNYQRLQTPTARTEINQKIEYFENVLADFESYDLTDAELESARVIRTIFGQIKTQIAEVVHIQDLVVKERDRFVALRVAMDSMLDDEIQPLARQHLAAPRQDATEAAERSVRAMSILIPLYVVGAFAIGILLVRSVIGPLNKLKTGAVAIGARDLNHRINVKGSDEFAELATEFNNMVAQLQVTTVSKRSLEASEQSLHATVSHLRREIAEREHAEAEQVKLQAALRRSETMSAMGALVAGVAHEVRNPLFGISATLDAMDARFADGEEHRRYSNVLRVELDRLSTLLEDLLEFGKAATSETSPASMDSVISEAVMLCTPLAQHAQVDLMQHVEPDLPLVRVDQSRMALVFRNLIENAIQHSPVSSSVWIRARRHGDSQVACTVEDSGSGLNPDDLEHIFDPFFTRRPRGTGLGLSIVMRIVEHHKGTVRARNRQNGGAAFTVCLPAAAQQLEQSA